jgi:hypothetical protein
VRLLQLVKSDFKNNTEICAYLKSGGGGQNSQIDINARICSPQVIEITENYSYE